MSHELLPARRPYAESEPRQFPDGFPSSETEKPMDEILIAYMSRRLGLGWEDIAKKLPDVPTDVIKAIVFCKITTALSRGTERGP